MHYALRIIFYIYHFNIKFYNLKWVKCIWFCIHLYSKPLLRFMLHTFDFFCFFCLQIDFDYNLCIQHTQHPNGCCYCVWCLHNGNYKFSFFVTILNNDLFFLNVEIKCIASISLLVIIMPIQKYNNYNLFYMVLVFL